MRKTRKKRSWKRVKWLFGFAAVVLVALLGWYLGKDDKPGAHNTSEEDKITRVIILGVDRRADDVGRSDTLMVASIREEDGKGALLSLPRDTRVAIKDHGYDKLNHAYAYGGHELSRSTVEELIGVPIDRYVLIDTKAFERIVDAVGGVDIDVEKRMYYEDPWDDNGGLVIDLYPGEQHMDGDHAIQYVRYRDGEGDIGRIKRQQKFMKALLARVLSPDILSKLPAVVEEIKGAVETDMSLKELVSFASVLETVRSHGLETEMLPGKPAYLADVSYWMPNVVAIRKMIVEDMNVKVTPEMLAAAERAAREYEANQPKDMQVLDSVDLKKDNDDKERGGNKDSELNPEERKDKVKDKKEREEKDNKADEKDMKPLKPEEISVLVINSSGINGAGAEVADVLRKKGFVISSVETGKTSSWEHTTITTSTQNTDLFYGMPFPCLIMDGGGKNQAVVNIGLDYNGKR